ncbi:putative transporter [Teratosphaeria destructans]|uniref:Transporter n=1 Tax=Teratosphaeria destructans TaxID=418781 RepID=A0A9W7SK39_9PEZI|nr:putative transporter [Teratosphaeria destructans]
MAYEAEIDNGHLPEEEKVMALQAYDKSVFKKEIDDDIDGKHAAATVVEPVVIDHDGEVIRESDYSLEDYKKLLKKIDRYLLPLMWFCTQRSLVLIAFSRQTRLRPGLRLSSVFARTLIFMTNSTYVPFGTWSVLLTAMQVLMAHYNLLHHISLRRIPIQLFAPALGSRSHTEHIYALLGYRTPCQLMALRGLQGFFGSTISPGLILIVGTWYRTEEHSARALFWQSANAGFGIISSLVMYGIGVHAEERGGLDPWRSISLFLGSATIALALVCFALLGSPKEVHWLSKAEKRMAAARIVKNKAGRDVTGVKWSWPQVYEAFLDPQLWFCMTNAFLSSVPNGALTTFGSIMYKSFGFTQLRVLLIDIPRSGKHYPDAQHRLLDHLPPCFGIYTRKVPNKRLYIMAASTIPPFVGMLAMSLVPNTAEYKWAKWGMYLLTVPFVLALFLAWTLSPSNVAGRTKKTIISSATFLGYCVGNMCGSQIFKSKDVSNVPAKLASESVADAYRQNLQAPRYVPGTTGAAVCFGTQFILICCWRVYYIWQNRRRENKAAESRLSREEQEKLGCALGERNITDLQNLHFRYTM